MVASINYRQPYIATLSNLRGKKTEKWFLGLKTSMEILNKTDSLSCPIPSNGCLHYYRISLIFITNTLIIVGLIKVNFILFIQKVKARVIYKCLIDVLP